MAQNYVRAESTDDFEGTKLTWSVSAAQILHSPLKTRSSQTSTLYSFPINKQNVKKTCDASKVSDVQDTNDNADNDDVFLDSSFQLARNVALLKSSESSSTSSLIVEAVGSDIGVKTVSPDATELVSGHLNVKLSRLSISDVADKEQASGVSGESSEPTVLSSHRDFVLLRSLSAVTKEIDQVPLRTVVRDTNVKPLTVAVPVTVTVPVTATVSTSTPVLTTGCGQLFQSQASVPPSANVFKDMRTLMRSTLVMSLI